MERKKYKVPDILIEKLLLGELSSEQEKEVQQQLASEPGGMKRLDQLRKENKLAKMNWNFTSNFIDGIVSDQQL